jgi:putative tricarboxylic transport membrane protein
MQDAGTRRRDPVAIDIAAIVIAVVLFALAAVLFWDMSRLEISSTYGLGPKAMPIVVAIGLALLGIGNLAMAFTTGLPQPEPADRIPILLILGGLAALIALIGLGGGFIPATAILFACTATAFGRRAFLVDFIIGAVLGTIAYLLFDKLLTLSLPAGPLERLLQFGS